MHAKLSALEDCFKPKGAEPQGENASIEVIGPEACMCEARASWLSLLTGADMLSVVVTILDK